MARKYLSYSPSIAPSSACGSGGRLAALALALLLFSPIWITMSEPRNYLNFGVSLVLGILLLFLASKTTN